MKDPTISACKIFQMFPDEKSARERLEKIRWGSSVTCPHCKSNNIYTRKERAGFYDCRECKAHFSVRIGTVFEKSHVKPNKWIYAIYLLMTNRKSISSQQLSKEITITQQTARSMLHRLKLACGTNRDASYLCGINPMNGLTQAQLDTGMARIMAYQPSVAELSPDYRPLIRGSTTKRGTLRHGVADSILTSPPYNLSPANHSLIQGDATKRSTLKRGVADLIVTSPPYNLSKAYNGNTAGDELGYTDYLKFSRRWLENCFHWTRPTGRLCVNVSLDKNKNGKQALSADITTAAIAAGWKYHATVVWNEGNISRRTAWGSWKSASAPHIIAPVETIIILYKGNWKRERQGTSDISAEEFKKWVLGVWTFNGESAKRVGHEAPFPRELPSRCIKLLSFPGDTVLDPFVGSGTTMIEAINLGRVALGIEKELKYCRLSVTRIDRECKLKLTNSSAGKVAKSTANCWRVWRPMVSHTGLST